jgi:hypothetical protein
LFWKRRIIKWFSIGIFMETVRTFIAVDFPSEVIKEVARAGNFE